MVYVRKTNVEKMGTIQDASYEILAVLEFNKEPVRVYLSNSERICHQFVEERRGRLGKLIEDKVRWSWFQMGQLNMDFQETRKQEDDKNKDDIAAMATSFKVDSLVYVVILIASTIPLSLMAKVLLI
ncbi:hypothetical protein L2E82_00560 [Cichorium intybus]|uniref:Uncharacterized protein n=1 Tax=Cichorium intybus TaxID=13427 RepID=A0ACB9GX29_CICIN|nr:hypothetical protein L2E82_00560 [Cichorium intybus]